MAEEVHRRCALQAFELLGCAVFARVDLMLDAETPSSFVLEVNAIPGLTETSLLPQAADAAGIGFEDLVAADPRRGVGRA